MIQIESVSKTYFTKNGEITALKDISLAIEKGDIFGIIGMSGAGKSTLLRIMGMLEPPTDGKVLIDTINPWTQKPAEISRMRRDIGTVFQGYNLLSRRTVLKNIAFPLELIKTPKKEMDARCRELIRLVSLEGKENAYPAELSGGQKQRVAIARALATNPDILLCDEPTSALDGYTTSGVLDLLYDINQKTGVTIVIITHEIGVVSKICRRVAVLDSHSVCEQGLTQMVFSNPQSEETKKLLSFGGVSKWN